MQTILEMKNDVALFLRYDIWRIQLTELNRVKIVAIKLARIILLAIRGFQEDKLPIRASALTFYSLLSLVPVLAMIFGVAKGFGFQKMLERRIMETSAGQEVVMGQLVEAAQRLLDATKGGVIAGIGIAVLFYTVVKLLGHIEMSFNHIWGIKSARSLGRKFSDYLSVMLIAPLMLIISSGATVFITTQIAIIIDKISLLGFFSPIIFFMLKLIPYGVLWLLFTMVYLLMPNAKVKFASGLIAGIFTGTAVNLTQWVWITFQIGAAKYNAIYGSFAALPLFLAWLQITWIIILVGAEVSFAHQNAELFEYEPDEANASMALKKQFALHITHYVINRFKKGDAPQTAAEIAKTLQIPVRMVRNLINELVESHLFSTVKTDEDKEPAFQPAIDIHQISIQSVVEGLDNKGNNDIPFKTTPEFDVLSKALASFNQLVKESPENKLIMDIR